MSPVSEEIHCACGNAMIVTKTRSVISDSETHTYDECFVTTVTHYTRGKVSGVTTRLVNGVRTAG